MKIARRFLIVFLCVALLLAGMVAAFIRRRKLARRTDLGRRPAGGPRARGTTDYADIIPPPIPDDQNLAMAPLFVHALDYHVDPVTRQLTFGHKEDPRLDGLPYGRGPSGRARPTSSGGWERGRSTDLTGWQKYYRADPAFPRTPEPQSSAADVLLALTRYGPPLDELAQAAAARPRSRFPINWNIPNVYGLSLRHANLLQQLAATLRLRASAEVVGGDPAAAASDIALALRLSDALQYDSLLIDHLVNITILGLLAQPVWDGLAARQWNADELSRLQTAFGQENVLADYAHAMRCEEASVGRGIDFIERHRSGKDILQIMDAGEAADSPFNARMFDGIAWLAPRGWYDQNKARIVRYDQMYRLGVVDQAAHRVFTQKLADGIAAHEAVPLGPYTLFFLIGGFPTDGIPPRSARSQTVCDQIAIACALERFFLGHQTYPDSLVALVPDYLERVPVDVIDGAPMRYHRTPDGRYLLYGIGWNGRDDGGQVVWKGGPNGHYVDRDQGDWVWQYQPIQPPDSIQRSK